VKLGLELGAASGNWTGYWGKQGPELLDHRLALYGEEQRMVFGANTYRTFARVERDPHGGAVLTFLLTSGPSTAR